MLITCHEIFEGNLQDVKYNGECSNYDVIAFSSFGSIIGVLSDWDGTQWGVLLFEIEFKILVC